MKFSGYIESDTRFIIEDYRGEKTKDGFKFELNRNDVNFRLGIQPFEKVRCVVDTRLRYYGFNVNEKLSDLTTRDKIDPFSIYLDEAYFIVKGIVWDGMDLKIGRMIQNWGTADMFNPTDNLNSRDMSDPLDYSRKVPNQMVEVDLYPSEKINFQFVWVPVFKPAQLPSSAVLGFAVEYDKNGCFENASIPPLSIEDNQFLANQFSKFDPCTLNFLEPEVRTITPEFKFENSQAGAKANFSLGALDFSLSYYYGRFGFPIAYTAVANVEQGQGKYDVKYTAEVMYPRMHVAGLDFSYSAEWLFDMGFIGELAVYFPEEVIFGLRAYQGNALVVEKASVNVPSTPFIKATAGFDYTFTSWLYLNAMYVRGFFDEFNDAYGIHNYVVAATELKFFEDEWQIRLAGVLSADDHSAALQPQMKWIVYPSVELMLAGLIFTGDTDPKDPLDYSSKIKFGQKAAGRNVVSLKAKVTW